VSLARRTTATVVIKRLTRDMQCRSDVRPQLVNRKADFIHGLWRLLVLI
jgi:hypothetical protein